MSKSCVFSKKQKKQLPSLSLNIVKDIENFRSDKGDPAKLKQINHCNHLNKWILGADF